MLNNRKGDENVGMKKLVERRETHDADLIEELGRLVMAVLESGACEMPKIEALKVLQGVQIVHKLSE
jgi:hypothetical protein